MPASTTLDRENAARAFWTSEMEAAFAFMERMRRYPLKECGESLAPIAEAVSGVQVAYSERPFNERYARVYALRRGLGPSLRRVAEEMNGRGWILKIEDGYRSPDMQRSLTHSEPIFDSILRGVMWELEGKVPTPDLMLRRTTALIATRPRIGTHISGSAIDISVLDRESGEEIPRGGPYIEISERTPMESPFITETERANRKAITAIFRRHGWLAYPHEFWHYSSGDSYGEFLSHSGRPGRYGPVVFEGGTIRPIPDPESDLLLEPIEFYQKQVAAALTRLKR
jgi:D-alanyl-D-alanine dipeptidase